MSRVWDIVQKHIDDYGVREAEIARRMGTVPQTLNSWKKRGLTKLPDAALILGLSEVTKRPYREVLDAVLEDIRYLPEEVVEHDRRSAPMKPGAVVDMATRRKKPVPKTADAAARQGAVEETDPGTT